MEHLVIYIPVCHDNALYWLYKKMYRNQQIIE
nr:MAG TPA: hypothetical protein [Caudoviricetes sp.]